MDTDLLAFVTGLDPKEARAMASELEPAGLGKARGKKTRKAGEKKVVLCEPTTSGTAGGAGWVPNDGVGFDAASLADFTSVLAGETGFAGLKRRIGAIAEDGDQLAGGKRRPAVAKVVEAPLPKVQQDRIERQVAYMQTAKELSKWQPVIQQNRQAKSLAFPLYAPPANNVTTASMVSAHAPQTDMEREILESLQASGMATEGDICRWESMEMNKLSARDIEARFADLAKKRSLLFFQERKQKHQSKIKSKKFRKIKAKERAKEEAKKEPTETPAERRERAEMARAKERLTLKTRKANKWAQEMIHRRGLEPGSRQEIVDQLRDKERLRQEIFGRAADAQAGSDEEEEEEAGAGLYLSEDEAALSQDYFESGSEQDDEAADQTDETDAEAEADPDAVVGRRTFGASAPEAPAGEDAEEAAPQAKQTKRARQAAATRSALFEAADSAELKQQQDIIKQAFAEDDLFAEFAAEKDAIVQADAPKTEDLTLPGWGTWSGAGVAAAAPRTRILRKVDGIAEGRRKDAGMRHVIINEKQNKKAQQTWMVPKVPFPFKSKEEYERATRQKPLGPEWNSTSGHRQRVGPRVLVKVGSIIDPIKFVKQHKH